MPDTFEKDPSAVLDYTFDWRDETDGPWLAVGETITTSTVTVSTISGDASPLTLDSSTNDDDTVTIWLSGGTAGNIYTATNRIVTSAGRTDDRSITIHCRER